MTWRDRLRRAALSTDLQGYPHRSAAEAITGDFNRVIGDLEMATIDASRIMTEIFENQRKLDGCARHSFPPEHVAGEARFRRRYRCVNCAGEVEATAIMNYCAGYAAAGGDPADVWPPYAGHVAKFREAIKP